MEDGQEVLGEFLFWETVSLIVENHEFSTVLFDKELYDFTAKSGESIPMGNNNPELISSQETSQYGNLKSFPLKVEVSTPVVSDDFCVWVDLLHVGNL